MFFNSSFFICGFCGFSFLYTFRYLCKYGKFTINILYIDSFKIFVYSFLPSGAQNKNRKNNGFMVMDLYTLEFVYFSCDWFFLGHPTLCSITELDTSTLEFRVSSMYINMTDVMNENVTKSLYFS